MLFKSVKKVQCLEVREPNSDHSCDLGGCELASIPEIAVTVAKINGVEMTMEVASNIFKLHSMFANHNISHTFNSLFSFPYNSVKYFIHFFIPEYLK